MVTYVMILNQIQLYYTLHYYEWPLKFRNGVVRFESVMQLRNKLEELGKMKGINQDEKGMIFTTCIVE